MLRSTRFVDQTPPEIVVRVGDLPTSKPLRAWLAGLPGTRQLAIDPDRAWQDPDGAVTELVNGDPVATLEALDSVATRPTTTGWTRWTQADRIVGATLADALDDELTEPLVAARIGDWLTPETTLLCAASMPIRDLELYLPGGSCAATRAVQPGRQRDRRHRLDRVRARRGE